MRRMLLIASLIAAAFLSPPPALAQDSPYAAPPAPHLAPVPQAIFAAKTVFISNAGADSGLFPHPFSGDPDRAYQEFYDIVQRWQRFQLVDDPAKADLVFELRLTAPSGPQNPNKASGASDPLPMFRLVVYDRATHYVLWALTQSIDPAIQQVNHDRNFDQALTELADGFRTLTQPTAPYPATPPVPAGKTRFQNRP